MTDFIKKIEKINFGLLSPEEIRAMSVVTVETPDTDDFNGFPIEYGLMDSRMGVTDPEFICPTCGFKGGECGGHFGSIELAMPVIHIGFVEVIYKMLRSTCNECGRVLLTNEQIENYTSKIKEALENHKNLNEILKKVYYEARRELRTLPDDLNEIDSKHCCPHCGALQEAIRLDMPCTFRQGDYTLSIFEVRERLEKISDEDSFLLGVNPEKARPEWLILSVLPVPPVTVRPSIFINDVDLIYDDLTHKLVDIVRINQRLLENMEAGAPSLIIDDLSLLLQYHVSTYFDNTVSSFPPARHRSGRPLVTLMQRLNGYAKDSVHDASRGRFRDNLSGKYVDFAARTVVSPDPNISINEVGVPLMVAKEETVPVRVTEFNFPEIIHYIKNGPYSYPGANYVIRNDGKKISLHNEESKEFILEQLQPDFIVERHLIDGDIVLLNRFPSLHKLSMLAHEVKVLPYKTFRINPAVCPPYNVDFDGDEMNIHVLQNVDAQAEAKSLMLPQDNIFSPRFGVPIIGAIRDHITGAYLLTKSNASFSEEEAFQLIRKSGLELPTLIGGQWVVKSDSKFSEKSYIFKDEGERWTGKELFSLTLPNDLNMSFTSSIAENPFCTQEDAYVVIKNGILLQGVIDETAIGSLKGIILEKIYNNYGSNHVKEFLEKVTKLSLATITKIGFTNSIRDYEIPKEAQDRIDEYLNIKILEADKLVESYEKGNLKPLPGRNLVETLNFKLNQVLKDARDKAGNISENYSKSEEELSFSSFARNSYVMAHTGDKSSKLNITQINACIGQQSIRGESFDNIFKNERGYNDRLFPHFRKGEMNAATRGFIKSSFLKGLNPIEFYLHAMGGRDSMVDKSIRVSAAGYMQKRLIHALQDVHSQTNGVVKDASGNVIQTLYGEDGMNPVKLDKSNVADLNKLIDEIRMNNEEYSIDVNKYEVNEDLSDAEIKKLKIKSKNLSNKLSFTIQDYSNFIKKANYELESLEDDDVNENLQLMLMRLIIKHETLSDYEKYLSELTNVEELNDKVETANKYLKDIKKEFNQTLYEIKESKHEELLEKFKEYEQSYDEMQPLIDYIYINFIEYDEKFKELIRKSKELSEYVDNEKLLVDLNKLKHEYDEDFQKLNKIIKDSNKKKLNQFKDIQHITDEIDEINLIRASLNQIDIVLFENRFTQLEKNYHDLLALDNKFTSGNVPVLLKMLDKAFAGIWFKRQAKKYKLQDYEIEIIKKSFEDDILNQVISDENTDFKKLLKSRCKEFRKNNSRLNEEEIDKLLETFNYSEIDEDIVDECKINVKRDLLDGKISINHVELKLNNYVSRKLEEINQLNELDQIKNDPNIPEIKIYLTSEEISKIYKIVEEEIRSEYGLKDNVETHVEYLIRDKIQDNKSEARGMLSIIQRDLSNLTELNNRQQDEFIRKIEYSIEKYEIRYYDINEEKIIKLSEDFINFGKFRL